MDRFIIIIIGLLTLSVLYSYVARKFTRNKGILYLPSYIGIILIIYLITFYSTKSTGFEDLASIISAMLVLSIILGNLLSGLIMNMKRKK